MTYRSKKHTPCPNCCPDFPVPFDREGEVWVCQNCNLETPVGPDRHAKTVNLTAAELAQAGVDAMDGDDVAMTERQAATVDILLTPRAYAKGRGIYGRTSNKPGQWEKARLASFGDRVLFIFQDHWLDHTTFITIGPRGAILKEEK